ncbi:MAG TPA: hypothetical protein VED24_02725 [Candidatus Acidoferrum sp.]|nr:hypothetical protein [Candidatus Acidoferrum sp.]
MKPGFDIHNYPHRMELAISRLKLNKKVSLHNRLKILRFRDYLETQDVNMARRMRYIQNLTKLTAMLGKSLESNQERYRSSNPRPRTLDLNRLHKEPVQDHDETILSMAQGSKRRRVPSRSEMDQDNRQEQP